MDKKPTAMVMQAGYQGAEKRPDMPQQTPERKLQWHIAMKRQKRKALDPQRPTEVLQEQLEKVKSSIRAKVEHPFRVIKRQFGHVKTRYRGLRKNTQNCTPCLLWRICGWPVPAC